MIGKKISSPLSPDLFSSGRKKKNSITAARRAAIASAIVARESAIAALGPIPTPPLPPQRPSKIAPQGMNDQKDKKKR